MTAELQEMKEIKCLNVNLAQQLRLHLQCLGPIPGFTFSPAPCYCLPWGAASGGCSLQIPTSFVKPWVESWTLASVWPIISDLWNTLRGRRSLLL